jgi:hypothetical protein
VYVVGAVNHPVGFVMENNENEKVTVPQAVALRHDIRYEGLPAQGARKRRLP